MTTVFSSFPMRTMTPRMVRGSSRGRIYREEIRREVELSPLWTKIETKSEKATSEIADEFPASPLEIKDE